jgi:hypothetical protein
MRRIILTLTLAVLAAAALAAAMLWGNFTWSRVSSRLLRPLLSMTLAIGVGLFLGMVIESANLTARLGRVFTPLLRLGRLREPSAAAFTVAFFSAISASAMLMNSHRDGAISRRELTLSALILTFPAFFAHAPSMFFIITPLVGRVGVYYLAALLGADLLRTSAYLLYGRLALPSPPPAGALPQAGPRPQWRQILKETWGKFLSRLQNILAITLPVFVMVFLAQEGGLFDWLRARIAEMLHGTQIPVQALGILIFSLAAETAGGFAAAGAILESQALSPAAVLLTLLAGTIIASPMRAVRHQLPYYLGVYTPALGLRLMVLSHIFRTLSIMPFMAGIWWWM